MEMWKCMQNIVSGGIDMALARMEDASQDLYDVAHKMHTASKDDVIAEMATEKSAVAVFIATEKVAEVEAGWEKAAEMDAVVEVEASREEATVLETVEKDATAKVEAGREEATGKDAKRHESL